MYEYSLDWQFAAAPDRHRQQSPCGYLLALRLGATTALIPDITSPAVFDQACGSYPGLGPAYDAGTQRMVTCGFLERLGWSGATSDPLRLTCQVSAQNQRILQAAMPMASDEVAELKFWLIDYATSTPETPGGWYEAAYPMGRWPTGTEGFLKGRLAWSGSAWAFQVSDEGTAVEGTKTRMFACDMSIEPAVDAIFTLFGAKTKDDKIVRPWGLMTK
ncbi:hypothetical protein [Nocardia tenerifensis]|nr:hypothetical protein [Nocardia tenerifensis]